MSYEVSKCETFKYKSHKNIISDEPMTPLKRKRTLSEEKEKFQFRTNIDGSIENPISSYTTKEKKELWKMTKNMPSVVILSIIKH